MSHLYYQTTRYLERLGPHEWVIILAALIVVGVVCLRVFGSRSNY
jgi:hypothetical protein